MKINYHPEERFAHLFRGRTDAFGTGKGRWVKRTLRTSDYEGHLRGFGEGLGVAPLLDDGMLHFASIDLDEPDFEAAREMMGYLPGPSFLERSRSGNAHVHVFFSEACDAWVARGILRDATLAAGKTAVEVFPKQDRLLPGMIGNYINLPYFGNDRPVLDTFKLDNGGEHRPLALEQFLDAAEAKLNDPSAWKKRAQWLQISPPEERLKDRAEFGSQKHLHICAEHIIANRDENPVLEGFRSVVYFSLAKQILNCEMYGEDEAWEFIRMVNDASPDRAPEGELRRILGNAMRGQFTSTGCDDPLMSPYVHPDCPIARG